MAELTSFENDQATATERHGSQDLPWEPTYRVRTEAGEVVLDFELRLVGISRSVATDLPPDSTRPRGISMPVLEIGQSLEFISLIDRQRLDCVLRGNARAKNEDDAHEFGRGLWQNLRIPLADGRSDYRFAPAEGAIEEPRFVWSARLAPSGLCIRAAKDRRIGYTSDAFAAPRSVLLPFPAVDRSTYVESLARGAVDDSCSLGIRISLAPVLVNEKDHELLGSLVDGNEITGEVCYASGSPAEVLDPSLLEALRTEFEHWRHTRVGLHIDCIVYSDSEPAATLLAAIGRDIFGNQPVTWIRQDEFDEGRRSDDTSLDLRCVINPKGSPPPLLPTPESLVESGIPSVYSYRPLNLPRTGLKLGTLRKDRSGSEVFLADNDRSGHCYILGASGTGKSTLLFNMVMQDVESGGGLCLLDPHGDLYEQVLDAIPRDRARDVVLIDASDPDRAVGINFLECPEGSSRTHASYITNEMIKIFDRLYDLRQTGGPIFEQYMRNALLLIMENEVTGGTLMDVPYLFENDAYRKFLIDNCTNRYAFTFWTKQAHFASGDASMRNIAPYITSKLNQFTANAMLRPIIGQSVSTVRFDDCMDQRRIVLVNLSKGLLGSLDSQLLGMLIIGKIFGAALGRASKKFSQRTPFHLYVDEVQNLATDTMVQMTAEARKYGLFMHLANQNLAQLMSQNRQASLMEAVLGNVGTMLLFRLGAPDAQLLETYVKPELDAQTLQELPNHHIAGRLMIEGRPTRPFVFETNPLRTGGRQGDRRRVRAAVNRRKRSYTTSVTEVEDELIRRRTEFKNLGPAAAPSDYDEEK